MGEAYQESLDYLYSLQFFGIKLGLENIRTLLDRIDNPQRKLRIIHIAGTNGKGSTAAALAGIFKAAGIRAGLYTSPHLHNFTERVRVDTEQITEADVVALTAELRPHAEQLRATFFEFTTALALLYFVRQGAEWAVLETGLGGRLDATNVVTPELSVITPIALDHTAYLGESLAEVAAEKAGIIKPGVPVVCAVQPPEAAEVLRRVAAGQGAQVLEAGRDFVWSNQLKQLVFRGFDCEVDNLQPKLTGSHQRQNLSLALAAAAYLRSVGVNLPLAALRNGVEGTLWPGRLEWLDNSLLVDGAHNPAGAEVLADYLRQRRIADVHLLIGLKADKSHRQVLERLLPFTARLYAVRPPVDEAVAPEALVREAEAAGVPGEVYAEIGDALQAARSQQGDAVLLVAGSLFLVAAVREAVLPSTEILPIFN